MIKICDGCGAWFSFTHEINCKKLGLVYYHYNKLCDVVAYLYREAYMPLYVRKDSLIYTGNYIWGVKSQTEGNLQPKNPSLIPGYSNKNGYLTVLDL